jgi:glycyl-tRNA synthetase beta chain
VLRARFNDAQFFWQTDLRTPLESRLELLKSVTFQAQLGSYYEKSFRMKEIVEAILQAALLAKCDLTTDLVKEFTELQGVVGGLYAQQEGMSAETAAAIYDHYKPESMEGPLPSTLAGAVVSLADRIDTLMGCFGLGLAPSGSKDPLGLRRAAQGIIRILAEMSLPLTLDGLVGAGTRTSRAMQEQGQLPTWDGQMAERELLAFLEDRLRYYLREVRGFAYDEVNAVMAAKGSQTRFVSYEVTDVLKRVDAVHRIRPTENFEPLAAAFKRIKNILQQAANRMATQEGGRSSTCSRKMRNGISTNTISPSRSGHMATLKRN